MITTDQIIIYKEKAGEHLQNVKTAFENLDLKEAIEKAAKSIDQTNDNKMFSHQRRVGINKASEGYEQLKDKELDFRNCIIFEDIIVITDEVKNNTKRLGDLWSYDTALRIGFHLKIYPTDVYIQAGVKKGYFKLLNKKPRKRKVPRIKFPMLDELEVYEIENFLCIWGSDKLIKKPC